MRALAGDKELKLSAHVEQVPSPCRVVLCSTRLSQAEALAANGQLVRLGTELALALGVPLGKVEVGQPDLDGNLVLFARVGDQSTS